jgi:SSS family solute:Na+ symporter
VPALLLHSFPPWCVGIAFAAIGIGALVPAGIMSIAAANLYTRKYSSRVHQQPPERTAGSADRQVDFTPRESGRPGFHSVHATQYAIQLQLLGGIWIIQTLPAVPIGAETRWFNSWALLAGRAADYQT